MTYSQRKSREGSTILESCAVIIILALILFAILQVSMVTMARDVLLYSSSAGARCLTVGYDSDMTRKAVRVAALPNMGPSSLSYEVELGRIEEYLLLSDSGMANGALGHIQDRFWESLDASSQHSGLDTVVVEVEQAYPLVFPLRRAFYGGESVLLESGDVAKIENHSALYLE